MKKNPTLRRKKPLAITLIMLWMVIGIIYFIHLRFGLSILSSYEKVYGGAFALGIFATSLLTFFGLTFFLILFIRRRKGTPKYFTYFIAYLIVTELIRVVIIEIYSHWSSPFLLWNPIVKTYILLLIMTYTNKNKKYFNR